MRRPGVMSREMQQADGAAYWWGIKPPYPAAPVPSRARSRERDSLRDEKKTSDESSRFRVRGRRARTFHSLSMFSPSRIGGAHLYSVFPSSISSAAKER